eukprot:4463563-Pleurochrysis_carterae.AAC.1
MLFILDEMMFNFDEMILNLDRKPRVPEPGRLSESSPGRAHAPAGPRGLRAHLEGNSGRRWLGGKQSAAQQA